MQFFPPIDPDEQRTLSFNFAPELNANEVLMGAITIKVFLTAQNVPDLTPLNILNGPASFDNAARKVLQPVANLGLLDGNDYEIEAMSGCTTPHKVCVVRGILQVRSD